jgi:hypothetical protein
LTLFPILEILVVVETDQPNTQSPHQELIPVTVKLSEPPNQRNEGKIRLIALGFCGILLISAIASVTYFLGLRQGTNASDTIPSPSLSQRACTEEAKICPDGSAVGRTGPNCEFAACPGTNNSIVDDTRLFWTTYEDEQVGYTLQYPKNIFIRLHCPGEGLLLTHRDQEQNRAQDVIEMPTCARDGRYPIEIQQLTQAPIPWKDNEFYTATEEIVTIAGKQTTKHTIKLVKQPEGPSFIYWQFVDIPSGSDIIRINLSSEELEAPFEEILKTFTLR